MPEIILATLNAKYIHAAFGLRYLLANLGELRKRAELQEFDINQRPIDIAEKLLRRNPKIIGFGIYIWNVAQITEVVSILKNVQPEITIILGGPEVTYATEQQEIVQLADCVITGEADLKFAEVCREMLNKQISFARPNNPFSHQMGEGGGEDLPKVIPAELPDFSQLVLPYDLYTDDDVAHRVIYVEASRGCPFSCEFCLSSLDIPVRQVPLSALLTHLQNLLDRGVKQFKFVDRTFNLNVNFSRTILEYILERHRPGLFFHFEMIPDRLPEALREIIAKFPAGALQFEVGVQTLNGDVEKLISRRQNHDRLEENFRFLRSQTGVHIHADLIVGLPGETVESFAEGFDHLVALAPQEIQVGMLKRLRGTTIGRHDAEWQMVYNSRPPYEVLQNKLIDFATMQKLRRFARYWDLVSNSGNFIETTPLIWSKGPALAGQEFVESRQMSPDKIQLGEPFVSGSPFYSFLLLSEWLYARIRRTDSIALIRLMGLFFEFLTGELKLDVGEVAEALLRDYRRGGRKDVPGFVRERLVTREVSTRIRQAKLSLPKRQARHLV